MGGERARRDWHQWHQAYDDPASSLSQRLRAVQAWIRRALDDAPPGPVAAISMCAGDGRDLLGVAAAHPRGCDLRARLVELDPDLAERARRQAAGAGLDGVEVVTGDAGELETYAGATPAHLVLVCGVFGNITDADVERTVRRLPDLCAPAATVVWTRHRQGPDLTPAIRAWFEAAGFDELGFDSEGVGGFGVGAHRLRAGSRSGPLVGRLFTFVR